MITSEEIVKKAMEKFANPPLVAHQASSRERRIELGRLAASAGLQSLLRLFRLPDVHIRTPNGTAVGFAWTKDDAPGGIVVNSATGETYFGGKKIAADFAEALELFRKRAVRLEYGLDPPEELYMQRRRERRNRRRAASRSRSRQRSASAMLPVRSEPPALRAEDVKSLAAGSEEGDGFMEAIRRMVGPR